MSGVSGFTVKTSELRSGTGDVTAMRDDCAAIATDVIAALIGMAGLAGHAGVESALSAAAGQGEGTYSGAVQVYQRISSALPASADAYDGAEQAIIAKTLGLLAP